LEFASENLKNDRLILLEAGKNRGYWYLNNSWTFY
jgi:hypothetical protein